MIWAALMICLVISFLLSGVESAVLSVSRVRVRHAADEGDPRAAVLLRLLEDRGALLGAVTVANHLANLAAFSIITWKLVLHLGDWGYAAGFLVALPVFLVGLEVVPKTIFRRYPFRILRAMLPVVRCIGLFRGPFAAFQKMSQPADDGDDRASAREDLKTLTASLASQKLLPPAAASLTARVIDYRRRRTRDLMVPLDRIIAVPPDLPAGKAAELASQRSLSSLPVLDEAGGFSGVLDVLSLPADLPPGQLVRQHMRAALDASPDSSALGTLQWLRKRGRSLAIVRDAAAGRAEGVVTEEDLIVPLMKGGQTIRG